MKTSIMRGTAVLALATLSLSLGGCITVLPKQQPVQLYRFVYDRASLGKDAPVAETQSGAPMTIALGLVDFPQASSSDLITTIENNEVTYVGGSRWAVPADSLFNEALSEGFARSAGTVRLEPRAPGTAPYRLDITVRHFETVYKRGRPTVSVGLDARLIRIADRSVVGDRYIHADVDVQHSDMSLMVEAYNKATTEAVNDLIGFTEETAAGGVDTATLPVAK